jgi:hypothetical protein
MEGLLGGKDGCQCHYFIDREGTVYEGKDEKFASDLAENTIVILLEGNLDGAKILDGQKASLVELSKELRGRLGLVNILNSKDLSGLNFPFDEFDNEFNSVKIKKPIINVEEKVTEEKPEMKATKTVEKEEKVEEPVVKATAKKRSTKKKRS